MVARSNLSLLLGVGLLASLGVSLWACNGAVPIDSATFEPRQGFSPEPEPGEPEPGEPEPGEPEPGEPDDAEPDDAEPDDPEPDDPEPDDPEPEAEPEVECDRCPVGQVCVDERCVDDLCQGVECPAREPECMGDFALRDRADGVCEAATGRCSFRDVEVATDCAALGRVCRQSQCVSLCGGAGCVMPQGFCDGDTSVNYDGAGRCDMESNTCDFSIVERRADCRALAMRCLDGACAEDPGARLMISEVLYNVLGDDREREWIEIFNGTGAFINLSGYTLGIGGESYLSKIVPLSGGLDPGECFVVGGPDSNSSNGFPTYDLSISGGLNMQNATGEIADAVALFALRGEELTSAAVPIDALIYGARNDSGFLDEDGQIVDPDIIGAGEGSSVERTGPDTWRVQPAPNPNNCRLLGQ